MTFWWGKQYLSSCTSVPRMKQGELNLTPAVPALVRSWLAVSPLPQLPVGCLITKTVVVEPRSPRGRVPATQSLARRLNLPRCPKRVSQAGWHQPRPFWWPVLAGYFCGMIPL